MALPVAVFMKRFYDGLSRSPKNIILEQISVIAVPCRAVINAFDNL